MWTGGTLPRRRRPSVHGEYEAIAGRWRVPTHGDFGGRIGASRENSGFKSFMHFSYYLMIAALVLVGFEVAYALYQLTLFVL